MMRWLGLLLALLAPSVLAQTAADPLSKKGRKKL